MVGDLHACFSSLSGNQILFYAEGQSSGVSFKGLGDCLIIKLSFPEKGINTHRCWLDLSDLPAQYAGGVLTTNTLNSVSNLLGTETSQQGIHKRRLRRFACGRRNDAPSAPVGFGSNPEILT